MKNEDSTRKTFKNFGSKRQCHPNPHRKTVQVKKIVENSIKQSHMVKKTRKLKKIAKKKKELLKLTYPKRLCHLNPLRKVVEFHLVDSTCVVMCLR